MNPRVIFMNTSAMYIVIYPIKIRNIIGFENKYYEVKNNCR